MRVYLETLGCRLNYAEMASLGRQLTDAGHDVVGSVAEADICVLNSCAVTGEAARKSRQMARQLAHANPQARLVVTGCYATLEAETVGALPNVTLVVGNDRKDALFELMADPRLPVTNNPGVSNVATSKGATRDAMRSRLQIPLIDQPARPAVRSPIAHGLKALNATHERGRTRAFIKVQDGCHNRCTFCIVTVARGEERSRAVADVVTEVNTLHAAGYQEVVLTGVHLAAYGRDSRSNLTELVQALLQDTTIPRLRLSSLEPFDLAPEFFTLWLAGHGRLMPHLHLPAQSGSDVVLRRMARRNRVAEFDTLLAAARAAITDLVVTTDIIVGFPGESEADFADTVAFARRAGFAHMHVFPYSARAGTAAARMNGQLPEAVRRARSRVLNDLDAELGRAVYKSFAGQVRSVLWENTLNEPSPAAGTVLWDGLTDNYLRVRAAVPVGESLHNRITATRLTTPASEGLWGEIVDPWKG